MAARTLAAVAGSRMAGGRTGHGCPLLASCRRGGQSYSHRAHPDEQKVIHDDRGAATITAAQVEAALNRKNVEELHEERITTVLPEEDTEDNAEDAWVPDQATGVFVPSDDTDVRSNPTARPHPAGMAKRGSSSVLDQTVFVRDEDMEDVERPAIDIANANTNSIGK